VGRASGRISVLVMAGGLGRRFGGPGKVFADICGEAMVERILRVASALGEVYIAISPHTREPASSLCTRYRCIETRGEGYPWDLWEAASKLEKPVLVLPADMPFLTAETLRSFVERALEAEEDVVTLRVCSGGGCEPVGVSLIRGDGGSWVNVDYSYSYEFLDVDTQEDLARARELCGRTVGGQGPG